MDEASTATAKVERAVAIGKGAAAGNVLDPAQLGLEADALLDLTETETVTEVVKSPGESEAGESGESETPESFEEEELIR